GRARAQVRARVRARGQGRRILEWIAVRAVSWMPVKAPHEAMTDTVVGETTEAMRILRRYHPGPGGTGTDPRCGR
uniref:hypothetical protein n=1 Tax=Actinomyces viscosus TaxID=1656 RepID=UPI002852A9D0